MAPKRKNRVSLRKASTPVQDDEAMAVDTPEVAETPEKTYDILKDLWTDEQETSLFKGIIKWKPSGMHKHFRMIALSEHLRNHGYDAKSEPHTSIPGIWEKLGTLYNLEVIDERENSFDWSEEDTVVDKYREFTLPSQEFADRMWEQGRAKDGSSSPEPTALPARKRKRGETVIKPRASTVDDTDEAKSSPGQPSSIRAGRGRKKGRGRIKADESDRQTTVDETDEHIEEEDAEVNEDQGEEEDGEDDTPSPKPSRSAAKAAKAATQARAQSKTRKSTRRK
ncbi:MAG: hypothetical protein M1818_000918 [Claussenomyces sp. TS43310]|nr:MAG: hypothetical protein M1818_000918 [Claussenomyces sp. TS43310]